MPDPIKGVAFNGPPRNLMASATRVVDTLVRELPKGTNGAVVGVATDAGMNAAIVHRVGERFQVAGWLGKESGWGSRVTGGGAIRMTW